MIKEGDKLPGGAEFLYGFRYLVFFKCSCGTVAYIGASKFDFALYHNKPFKCEKCREHSSSGTTP